MRKHLCGFVILVALLAWPCSFLLSAEELLNPRTILDVGNHKQLFIDNRFFSQQYGIKLTTNPPIKKEMVLTHEKPWEERYLALYSTIIEDNGIYKLWYDAFPMDGSDGLASSTCYATSTDGIHWKRENVNLFNWRGHQENNIVMPGCGGGVIIDPKAPPQERYKATCQGFENSLWSETQGVHWDLTGGGIYLFTSPDGIHWKRAEKMASPMFHDSQNFLLYDDSTDKYIFYPRTHERGRTLGSLVLEDPMKLPFPFRQPPASKKPNQWGQYLGINFGSYDIAMACDAMDPPDTDVQICPIVKYQWAQDVFLGLFVPYRHYPENIKGKFINDGPQDVQLAVSRDGLNWNRPDRKPYIPLGVVGEWDGGCIWPSLGMIRRGNEIWQYYSGTSSTHGAEEVTKLGGLCRLVQRLDGFVSADADYTGGEFTTPLLKFAGNQLTLNVDCSAMGSVWVEILDEHNRPIPGYTFKESIAVERNQIAAPVRWSSHDDVGALKDQPIRLRVKLRACKLYAFQFAD